MSAAMALDSIWQALTVSLAVFMLAAFVGALVAGLAGFAFGLVASALWLHIISPAQTSFLIAAFSILIQGYATWRLRHAVKFSRLWPFILGGLIGIPIGAEILRSVSPAVMRTALGGVLIAICIFFVSMPRARLVKISRPMDVVIGVMGGILGPITGFAGLPINISTMMRGWSKDEQRAVFQPVAVILFIVIVFWLGGTGIVPDGTLQLFVIGLPMIALGTWLGLKLYGRLDDVGFRRLVLGMLFLSGLTLLPSAFI